MESKEQPQATPTAFKPWAMLPLTPKGAANFAEASLTRLWVVQGVFALAISLVMTWFLATAWFPQISTAIQHLPDTGHIDGGRLEWTNSSPQLLGENRFISLVVDVDHEGQARTPSDLQVEFGATNLLILSIFGSQAVPYPPDYVFLFNGPELVPWWGAWAPPLLVLATLAGIVVLMASWFLLATLYWVGTWVLGYFCNRDLSWGGAWRLAGAALMPAGVFQGAAILLYGLGILDLMRLLLAGALHVVVGWIFLCATILSRPRLEGLPNKANPFTTNAPGSDAPPAAP